jgi:hypothetical protein
VVSQTHSKHRTVTGGASKGDIRACYDFVTAFWRREVTQSGKVVPEVEIRQKKERGKKKEEWKARRK